MATLLELYNAMACVGSALHNKFTSAVVKKAGAVLIEDPGTLNHDKRLAWANYVLTNLESAKAKAGQLLMLAVSDNGDVQTGGDETDDYTVEYVVNFYLDRVAV